MSKAKIISSVVRKVWKAVGGKGKKQTTALPTRHRRANPSNMAWQNRSQTSVGRAPGGSLGRPMRTVGSRSLPSAQQDAINRAGATAERRSLRMSRRLGIQGTAPRPRGAGGTVHPTPPLAAAQAKQAMRAKQAHGPARNYSMLGPKSLQHQKAYEKMQKENIKHLTRGAKAATLYTAAYLGYKTGRNRGK